METTTPNRNIRKRKNNSGMTLVETLGVMAIIAAALAITITSVIKSRQATAYKNVPALVDQIKAGLMTFTQKTGGMAYPPLTYETATGGIPTTGALLGAATAAVVSKAATIDTVLLAEGIIDKPISLDFGSKVNVPNGSSTAPLLWNAATNSFYCNPDAAPTQDFTPMTHIQCAMSTTNAPGTDGTNFYLDNSNTSLPTSTRVVALIIPGVTTNDAIALANYVNNSTSATATGNTSGPVTYGTPTNGTVTVYYHVAHY
jgi:competence protein ComGC